MLIYNKIQIKEAQAPGSIITMLLRGFCVCVSKFNLALICMPGHLLQSKVTVFGQVDKVTKESGGIYWLENAHFLQPQNNQNLKVHKTSLAATKLATNKKKLRKLIQ